MLAPRDAGPQHRQATKRANREFGSDRGQAVEALLKGAGDLVVTTLHDAGVVLLAVPGGPVHRLEDLDGDLRRQRDRTATPIGMMKKGNPRTIGQHVHAQTRYETEGMGDAIASGQHQL